MSVKEEQSLKAEFPILETELGTTTLTNEEQFWNVKSLITLIEEGIIISISEEQSEKAIFSISVTESGIVILVKDSHPKKDAIPIFVTEEGITNSFNDEQYPNVWYPIVVTDEGNVIFLSFQHLLNSFFLIFIPGWCNNKSMIFWLFSFAAKCNAVQLNIYTKHHIKHIFLEFYKTIVKKELLLN